MKKILIACVLLTTLAQAQTRHCKGVTSKGVPCKSIMVMKDGYCRAHSPSAIHCTYIKKNGERCKMVLKTGEGTLCKFHRKEESK